MRLIISILAIFMACADIVADTFGDVVETVVSVNTSLGASRRRAAAEMLQRAADNTLAPLEIEGEYLISSNVENRYSLGVTQAFDWPSAYSARRRGSEAMRRLADAQLYEQEIALRNEVSALLVAIVADRKSIEALNEVVSQCGVLMDVLTDGYERGSVSILDVNKMRIEQATYLAMLSDRCMVLDGDMARLRALVPMGVDVDSLIAELDEFPAIILSERTTYTRQASEHAPSLLVARALTDAMQADVATARAESMPGFSIGYRLAREDGVTFNGFSVGVSLPVWSASKRTHAAEVAVDAARLSQDAAMQQVIAQIDNDYDTACRLKQQIDAFAQALVTTDNIGLLRQAYQGGSINLTSYILDATYFVEARLRLYELQQQYFTLLTALDNSLMQFLPK